MTGFVKNRMKRNLFVPKPSLLLKLHCISLFSMAPCRRLKYKKKRKEKKMKTNMIPKRNPKSLRNTKQKKGSKKGSPYLIKFKLVLSPITMSRGVVRKVAWERGSKSPPFCHQKHLHFIITKLTKKNCNLFPLDGSTKISMKNPLAIAVLKRV